MHQTDLWMGVDDHRAAAALEAWHKRGSHGTAPYVTLACRRCGDHGPIAAGGWCHRCADDARWAASNRAMCDLLHRGRGR